MAELNSDIDLTQIDEAAGKHWLSALRAQGRRARRAARIKERLKTKNPGVHAPDVQASRSDASRSAVEEVRALADV